MATNMDKGLYAVPIIDTAESALEIEIENPESVTLSDGSMEITLLPDDVSVDDFDANIAEFLDEGDLQTIASEMVELVEADVNARKEWADTYVKGLEVLGFKYEDRTEPWDDACGVYSTVLAEAVIRFQAETMSETFPAQGPVKSKIIGEVTKEKEEKFDFTIINYDGTTVVLQELKQAKFDLIIVDEANAYKSSSTKRWKTLAKLLEPTTWLWMMTGTPASQSPEDAFGLAKLVSPTRVPKFSTAWRDRVMISISKFKWLPKRTATDEVFRALQPAIRYTKKECLDLPDIVYQTRDVPLTHQVLKYYTELKKQLLIEAAGEQVSAVNAAASLNKLLQISAGAVYTDRHDIVQFDISPRLIALKEVLEETTNKVVVFVPFLHSIQMVSEYLQKEGILNEVIMGSVSARQRSEIIARFQNSDDPKVLIIQPQAAAHGITLTAADTVVFWSPVMSVETYLQCIARIERYGQVNKMLVVHLRGSDVEKKMYEMLQGKVDSHQKLVDLYKQELEEV